MACCLASFDVVKYLVKLGVNVNAVSSLQRTALSKCCFIGRHKMVEYLLTLDNVRLDILDDKGRTALH